QGLCNVVPPDAHVAAAAFDFQAIVPTMAYEVAVEVRVFARCAEKAPIAAAADPVVVHVVEVRKALTVADHVVTGRVEKRNALRPLGVVAISLVPGAAGPARVVDLAPLDDEALQGPAPRENAGLVVAAEAGRRVAPAPVGNVAILDDDIVSTAHFDGA